MTTPKKPLSKTESAIQLGNVLKYAAGGRGGKLRKIGEKATKSASPIKEVKKAKKSLKNQKVNKSAKVSGRDAVVYGQPTKHGSPIGQRGLRTLAEKHPKAAMNKRIPAGTITNKPRTLKEGDFLSLPKAHRTARLKKNSPKSSSYKKIIKENRLGRFKGKK